MNDSNNRAVPVVSKEDIVRGLRAVGVESGDVVFAHSSLSSFGHVEGGADTVVDALLEAAGPQGTVVLPTFTWDISDYERELVFDLNNTPSYTGAVPEAFRKRKNAVRGLHLCHSVAAIGPNAEEAVGDGRSPFGHGSAFEKLYEMDAAYLLLGVGFRSCTALHMAEELMKVPYRRYVKFANSKIILPDGATVPSPSVEFHRKKGYGNNFAKMDSVFASAGILQTAQVGKARIVGMRIRQLFDVACDCLKKDIGFLLSEESRQLLHKDHENIS